MSHFVTLLDAPPAGDGSAERPAPATLRTFGDLQALVDAFDLELAAPIRHDVAQTGLTIVQVGVTLRLPADVGLLWARFTATLWTHDAGPSIVDVLPSIVLESESATGPVDIDDDGRLRRAPVAGDPAVGFGPFVSGYLASPRMASWDFFPRDGRLPPAASKLVLSIRDAGEEDPFLLRGLHVRIGHPASKPLSLTLLDEPRDAPATG